MVPDPTGTRLADTCGTCHDAIVQQSQHSLHTTLAGIKQSLIDRSGGDPLTGSALETAFQNHCSKCHGDCGDCHISVPGSAGGGLIKGHAFRKTPSTAKNCTACHGSRLGAEYRGENEGVPADLHYAQQMMQCTACHSAAEMHGAGQEGVTRRYDVTNAPRCQDCHPADATWSGITHHSMHSPAAQAAGTTVPSLSCQVCHAMPYKTCYSCHVRLDETDAPVYEVNGPSFESKMDFKIGHNPEQGERHPEDFVTLRHVPIDPANFEHYGANLLTTFDANPTWRLATPHTIQRFTPQAPETGGCSSACHGNAGLFLTPDDLTDGNGNPVTYEQDANTGVVTGP